MSLLSIVTRELQVASRRRSTYMVRLAVAAVALLGMASLYILDAFQVPLASVNQMLFNGLAIAAFAYCLAAGVRATVDCLSYEKREGTLGLLFLTDLKGYDIVLGKLVSSSVATFCGLMALFPLLTVVLLLGGISGSQILRVSVMLLNTLFFSLSVGLFVSSISQNERKALFAAGCLLLTVLLGQQAAAVFATEYFQIDEPFLNSFIAVTSPAFCLKIALQPIITPPELLGFYTGLAAVHLTAWGFLSLASWILPKTSKDRPKGKKAAWWKERWMRLTFGNPKTRAPFRARLLDQNAFFWLCSRERMRVAFVWFFLGCSSLYWLWGIFEFPEFILEWNTSLVLLSLVQLVLKIWCSSEVCMRFVEDRRIGAWELLLSTPLSVHDIARGQRLALQRLFAKPLIVLLIAEFVLLLAALNQGSATNQKGTITSMFAAMMVMLPIDMLAIFWVALWRSMLTNNINAAQVRALGMVLALPWIFFLTLAMSLRISGAVDLWSEEYGGWTLALIWLGISLVVDLVLIRIARWRFFTLFRLVATERFKASRRRSLAKENARPIWKIVSGLRHWKSVHPAIQGSAKRSRYLGLSGAVAVVLVGLLAWPRIVVSRKIGAELARLSQAGLPLSAQEFASWDKPVPTEENAAEILNSAMGSVLGFTFTSTNCPGGGKASFAIRTEALTEPMKKAVREALDRNRETVQVAHDATRRPKSRFAGEMSGQAFGTWHRQMFQTGFQLFMESMLKMDEGDVDQAIESLRALLGLARVAGAEPYPVAQELRQTLWKMAFAAIERLLNQHALGGKQSAQLSEAMRWSGGDASRLERVFVRTRVRGIEWFHLPARDLGQIWGGSSVSAEDARRIAMVQGWMKITGAWDKDYLLFITVLEQLRQASSLPPQDAIQEANRVASSIYGSSGSSRFSISLPGYLLPPLQLLVTQEARCLAWEREAETALAIERFREVNNGLLPDRLDELAPRFLSRVPADPYDGKPLRYRRLETGYLILSVGENRLEDGGIEEKTLSHGARLEFKPSKGDDITFKVERNTGPADSSGSGR